MNDVKQKALEAIMGAEAVASLISRVEATERTAEDAGILSKAEGTENIVLSEVASTDSIEANIPKAEESETTTETVTATETDPELASVDELSLADLTLQEVAAFITHIVTPIVAGNGMQSAMPAKAEAPPPEPGTVQKALADLQAFVARQAVELQSAQRQIADLLDDAPSGVRAKGYLASTDPATTASPSVAKALGAPSADPQNGLIDFINGFALNTSQ